MNVGITKIQCGSAGELSRLIFCSATSIAYLLHFCAAAAEEFSPALLQGKLFSYPGVIADGSPPENYWQQKLDYEIRAQLDPSSKDIIATGRLEYRNNSPHVLNEIWFELAASAASPDAIAHRSATLSIEQPSLYTLKQVKNFEKSSAGAWITEVRNKNNKPVQFRQFGTQVHVLLESPIAPQTSQTLHLSWRVRLVDFDKQRQRSGYRELDGGAFIFHVAQWYPQPVAYTQYAGWRNAPFVGPGEFAPEFGDYDVSITLPEGYIVAATGMLQNPKTVLTEAEFSRWEAAASGGATEIISVDEAARRKVGHRSQTWRFSARNVRDFAFAASHRYAWEAKTISTGPDGDEKTLAMAFYTPEAAALWKRFALAAIEHAVDVYARHTFSYPYPTVQAAFGPVDGMEHAMLAFSEFQPDGSDGRSYSREMKRTFLWVLVHEIGHNWFPMIVNSDERAWTWMDEGLNSFLEHLALLEWSETYQTRPNAPRKIGKAFAETGAEAVMTPADQVQFLFSTQYNRPAAALMILREVVLGRERFDHAFRTYAQRWRFKRPMPADFFRTIEQASGTDLSWFWRGWFFSTDHVDISLENFYRLTFNASATSLPTYGDENAPVSLTQDITLRKNKAQGKKLLIERRPGLADDYDVTPAQARDASPATSEELAKTQIWLDELSSDGSYYLIELKNVGGILTPVPVQIDYTNGESERVLLPVEIWNIDKAFARHLFWRKREIAEITVDPDIAIGDVDLSNHTGAAQPVDRTVSAPVYATIEKEFAQ